MITPTDRQLRIPAAIAGRHALAAAAAGIDRDEIESACNLAFAQALARFDPDAHPAGEAGFGSFAWRGCLWAARNRLADARREHARSLDAATPSGDTLLDELPGDLAGPADACADSDEAGRLLAGLPPRERLVLRLLSEGHTLGEAGRLLGVGAARAQQIAAAARTRARRRATSLGAGCGHDNSHALREHASCPRALATRERKRKASLRRAMAEARLARQAAGAVRLDGWYLVAPGGACWGDWPTFVLALAAAGVPYARRRCSGPRPWLAACLGWPGLGLGQALVLAALSLSPDAGLGVGALARATRLRRATVPTLAQRLCAAGLAASTGRRGPERAVYRVTAAGLAARGPQTPLRPLRGAQLPDDCRPLPPHLLERPEAGHPDLYPVEDQTP